MAIAPLVVGIHTRGVASLTAAGAAFRRFGANVAVANARMQRSLVAAGGLSGVMGRLAASTNRSAGAWARAGGRAASSFGRGLVNGIQSLPTFAQPHILAAAAVVGSLFASALGAAVLLAAGGGILAAGILAAVKDPAVSGAFVGLADRAKEAFKNFGTPFKAPMVRAATTFGDSVERIAPAFQRMGTMMAPLIDKLAPALGQMAEKMMPGLEKAVRASIPLFEKLAEHLPKIGESVSQFFSKVADAGPEITRVFDFILGAVEGLISGLGTLINWGAKFYSAMIGFWGGVKDVAVNAFVTITGWALTWAGTLINAAARAFGWVPGIGPKLQAAAAEFNAFAAKVNNALNGIQDEDVNVTIRARWVGPQLMSGAQLSGTYSSGIGGRASGGPVRKGVPYLVGEKRPEIFVPDSNGYIEPRVPTAAESRGMIAGYPAGGGTGGSGASSRAGLTLQYSGSGMQGLEALFFSWLSKSVRHGKLKVA